MEARMNLKEQLPFSLILAFYIVACVFSLYIGP
jgi:hypothetical protein